MRDLFHRHVFIPKAEVGRQADNSEAEHWIFQGISLRDLLFVGLPSLPGGQDLRIIQEGFFDQWSQSQRRGFRLSVQETWEENEASEKYGFRKN